MSTDQDKLQHGDLTVTRRLMSPEGKGEEITTLQLHEEAHWSFCLIFVVLSSVTDGVDLLTIPYEEN